MQVRYRFDAGQDGLLASASPSHARWRPTAELAVDLSATAADLAHLGAVYGRSPGKIGRSHEVDPPTGSRGGRSVAPTWRQRETAYPMARQGSVHGSIQRSFRLSPRTCDLLDRQAEDASESRTSLVERLLAEALRTERHPLIRFRAGGSGRREPGIVGTRLLVRQAMSQVRAERGDVPAVAGYLNVPDQLVLAAVDYYVDFADKVDVDAAWAEKVESAARERLARRQAALG